MATVQAKMLALAMRVDSRVGSGAGLGSEFTLATATTAIGSVDGEKFPKQRLLDIYNDARRLLFNEASGILTPEQLSKSLEVWQPQPM